MPLRSLANAVNLNNSNVTQIIVGSLPSAVFSDD